MKEKKARELVGKVVSDKNDKTITVLVETYKTDPLYKKRVKYSKNLLHMMKEMKQKLEILYVLQKLDHYLEQNVSVWLK